MNAPARPAALIVGSRPFAAMLNGARLLGRALPITQGLHLGIFGIVCLAVGAVVGRPMTPHTEITKQVETPSAITMAQINR